VTDAHQETTMDDSYEALVCARLTDDLSGLTLQRLGARPPGPGEVAVRVHAAALNFPDLLMTRGGYQHRPEPPFVPGMECAGVVESAGEGVHAWPSGTAVCISALTGGLAQRTVVPAAALTPMPARWDFASAAAWQVGAKTAYVALLERAGLQPGETLLVHGATGGMGAAAVQLGAHLGATVIATGSDPARLEPLRAMGASHLLSSRAPFADQVKRLTGGRGADVVFDPVGGDVFDQSTRAIGFAGRLLVVGFTSGRHPTVAANHVLIKAYSVIGVRAGEWLRLRPQRAPGILAELARLADAGVLKPWIGARFPLARAADAMRALERREAPGKIVVETGAG
jgi:NADPH2:quinone reductase